MSGALETLGLPVDGVMGVALPGHLEEGYKPQAASRKLAG
jgi:hypothetical protein